MHLNRYEVIKIDMQSFLSKESTVEGLITRLTSYIVRELKKAYQNVEFFNEEDLSEVLNNILSETGKQFILIIDEWDCVMRRYHDIESQKKYLDFFA
ncbi:N-acetylhexosamine 1-kinase [Lachnospiraceae bacterium TWA4]|nr:N-acetylhexosamine 1-kinase [Lachnospiraceae bacterium TWA4]